MLPARSLTFDFSQVVAAPGEAPEEWEIVLTPLKSPLDGTVPDGVLVGGLRSQTFKMGDAPVFEVVPSDAPGLSSTVWYRAGWRPRFFGRMETYDFTMPDTDITFDDLKDLGKVIGDSVYLRQIDLGVHVAAIDSEGYVLDGNGDRIGSGNVTEEELAAERQARALADQQVTANLQNQLTDQVNATLSTATTRIANAVSALQSADFAETGARLTAVATLNATINTVAADLHTDLEAIASQVSAHEDALPLKADLVNGKIVTSQLPALSLVTAVPVAGQVEMLALTDDQVQPGDIAVRPDGSWLLLRTPVNDINNWIMLSTGGGVQSVNGQEGIVHLGAADVGAIAIGAMISQTQITGLGTALAAKADVTVTNGLNTRLLTLENDTAIVRTVSGLIAKALMPADVAFVDVNGLLRRKDGTLIPGGGGSGGPVDWSQVVNVPATFPPTIGSTSSTAVAGNDARLTNARTPTPHAASHGVGQSDAITIAVTQVSTLGTTLTSLGNRTSSLETRVDTLESGGGTGGGGGSSAKTLWFDGPATIGVAANNFAAFQSALVLQKGPWGQADDGTYYYDPAGANNDEWRFPVLTPNGHLKLVKWDETAPADPVMATQSALNSLQALVDDKADSSTVTALAATVDGKVDTTTLTSNYTTTAGLTTLLGGKADTSALASKADASALATTNTNLAALTTTVGNKVDTSYLTANYSTTASTNALLAAKADLVAGKLSSSQIPTGIPQVNVANLPTSLAGKADLSGGVVPLTQLPAYPTSKVTNLDSLLAGKADLIGGKLASSQLPSLATTEVVPVANLAAMLALTTAQVQIGDIAVITGTADQGSYILGAADPSVQANWIALVPPTNSGVTGIFSANTGGLLTGNVTLTAADVGARNATTLIGSSDLTATLLNTINNKANASDLATKTSAADVTALMASQATTKITVNVVATANISLSGTPTIDGVPTVAGMRVLATNQTSHINNGIFVVSGSGTWLRATDMAGPNPSGVGPAGTTFLPGTLVIVTSGTANANTVWVGTGDNSGNAGVVGTAQNNWALALRAGPPLVYTAANNSGLLIDTTTPSAPTISVKNTTGISVTTAGVGVDHTKVPFLAKGVVPPGNANTTITHNLGTQDIMVAIYDFNTYALAGLVSWTSQDNNNVVLEFGTAPTTNQYRYVIFG
jgi:hypothetical protein